MFKSTLLSLALLLAPTRLSLAQQATQQRPPNVPPAAQPAPTPAPAPVPDEPPVVTKHEIRLDERTIKYTVTTGMMPIKNQVSGETEARVFFMAYTLDGVSDPSKRPLMLSFNGGPGSSSVWLHLGALGPKRVKMQDDGMMPAPPYQLVTNDHTWLDLTDLVFIDPVGTGYSRATRPELASKFLGLNGDLDSVGEFIRIYLTRHERWASPLFLVGESYGTTRASGLSGLLVDRGIAFNGVLLISTIMNFQTARFAPGNDLPLILILPSYTATAWYHKKLPADLQRQPLRKVLDEAEKWAINEYQIALSRGDGPEFDPSMAAIRPPYTAAFNDYVRRELDFKNDSVYHILGGGFTAPWDWGSDNTYADTSVALKSAFSKNPFMKLFIAFGHYDMATPYFAAEYTIDHMNLDPALKANIKTAYYEAGHMMYIDLKSLGKLKQDVAAFIRDAVPSAK